MSDPTELAGAAQADTEYGYAWGALDYDDPDEFPTQRLTPRRITALGVGASLVLVAGAGIVALWASQPVAIVPPAAVVTTTTTTTTTPPLPPPLPPPVTTTVTVFPPPPPVTVTVQTPAPTQSASTYHPGAACSPHEAPREEGLLVCVNSSSAGGWVWVWNEY
jgi:hypothetical protein